LAEASLNAESWLPLLLLLRPGVGPQEEGP